MVDEEIRKKCRLGVLFMQDHLIAKLSKKQQATALKSDRVAKWYKMVTYGLDSDIADKVIVNKNSSNSKNSHQ